MRSGVRGEAPPAGLVPGVNRAGVFHSGRQPSAFGASKHQANCPRGQPLGQVSFLGRWRVLGINRSGKFCRWRSRLDCAGNLQASILDRRVHADLDVSQSINRSGKFCRPTPRLPQASTVNRGRIALGLVPRVNCAGNFSCHSPSQSGAAIPSVSRSGKLPNVNCSDAHSRCRKHGTGCACPQRQPLGQALSLRQTPDA